MFAITVELVLKAAYEAGIDASFALHGLTGADSMYMAGGPYAYTSTGDVETDIGQIMIQKWIGNANINNVEGYLDVNRTHYPPFSTNPQGTPGGIGELTISYASVLPSGQTPKRLWYPAIEVVRNSSTPPQPTSIAVKVWWDKKQ